MKTLKVIKYNNRKIYCLNLNRYTSLPELAKFIRSDLKVEVISDKSKQDITKISLLSIIYKEELNRLTKVSEHALLDIIKHKHGLSSYITSLKESIDKKG